MNLVVAQVRFEPIVTDAALLLIVRIDINRRWAERDFKLASNHHAGWATIYTVGDQSPSTHVAS